MVASVFQWIWTAFEVFSDGPVQWKTDRPIGSTVTATQFSGSGSAVSLSPRPKGRVSQSDHGHSDLRGRTSLQSFIRGKLVALAAASNEVRQAYQRKYAHRLTQMENRLLPPHLVALTTTSAFGRSSLYNRLTYRGTPIAESLGYTEGYGVFHLTELYPLFRAFLEAQGISTRGGFGTGPRPKWQTMVRALQRLGLSRKLLHHSIKREVFLFRLVENLEAYMEGEASEPSYRDLPFSDLVSWWRERWLLPRANRISDWQNWRKEQIPYLLRLNPAEK
jgi:hypothetical protein